MKKIVLISVIASLFIGCGGSGGGSTDSGVNDEETSSDIVLKKGDTLTCTDKSSFSVEPTDKPLVNFSKDTENGDVTISMNKKSNGFVTVVGCTQK
jgi:hypothetical protein